MDSTRSHGSYYSGFTLIELMLTVGILSILLMISAPVIGRYVLRNDVDVVSNIITQDLYRAQSLARNGENDGKWGVYVQNGSITVFQGNSYATRNTARDEVYTFSSSITFTGQKEYVFEKFSGKVLVPGSITVVNASDNKVITVSSQGVVDY